jgi:hypothetical protein
VFCLRVVHSFLIELTMPNIPEPEPKYDSLFQLLTQRLYWMAIGPMILVLTLLGVLNGEKEEQIGFSIAFLVALAGIPLSRWLDMRSGQAMTADGKPATWSHFRTYVLLVVAVSLVALIAANAWVAFTSAR